MGTKMLIIFKQKGIETCGFYHPKEGSKGRKPRQKVEFSQVFFTPILADKT